MKDATKLNSAIDPDAALEMASRRPAFVQAAQAFMAGRLPEAERAARALLAADPGDAPALLLLAEIANTTGLPDQAVPLLQRALDRLPGHRETAVRLAELQFRLGNAGDALTLLDAGLADAPGDLRAATIRLAVLTQIGNYEHADIALRKLLTTYPDRVDLRLAHANLLRTLGRIDESESTYRSAIAVDPVQGEGWWGLADLKSKLLTHEDIATMQSLATDGRLDNYQQLHLEFALGKAREDEGEHAASFQHYETANRITRQLRPFDPETVSQQIGRTIDLLNARFFADRSGWGAVERAAIFVLGMPRAGSTLLDQMLASHSEIEGTAELPYIPQVAHELVAQRWTSAEARYPEALLGLDTASALDLGVRYLRRAALHRKTQRPFFVDKLNDNWPHIGLIHLILPNAIIIDARREPMACCFSNFKQLFARGRDFAYSQVDIARQYCDYERLTAHIDRVLPGRVLRVHHRDLVTNPEAQLRRVFDHIGLEFEAECLSYHENSRPVRTASAAQVRRPLDLNSDQAWRHYRPWLGRMEQALDQYGSR